MIFVFGSNLAGIHGKGAALYAKKFYGAKCGVGEGLTGSSYALPTKNEKIKSRCIKDVRDSVNTFIEFAKDNPDMTFNVTKVGCGLAGFTEEQIAPMFKDAPDNCLLPDGW